LFTCSGRPLTSADYLWRSCVADDMPHEEEVLEEFGFNHLISMEDWSNLLGLYKGLVLSDKVSAEDLHEWRVRGILVDKIKEFYYEIPASHRGGYFPWFLKNLDVLERPVTEDEAQQKLITNIFVKARPYLDIKDRNKSAENLEPEAKRTSFGLLAELLLHMHPDPIEKSYYGFGFVACDGKYEECTLSSIYRRLLVTESDLGWRYEFHNSRRDDSTNPVTFTQFWKAYESGTLIQLMDSKGLKELRSKLPLLEGFLSVPPNGGRPSVWDLKQFLEIDDPMDHQPPPPVQFDYGFMNCRTFEDTCILIEIYGKVLKSASPLELHMACVAGNLFQFASGHIRMEERWGPLMGNPYPLKELVDSKIGVEIGSEVGSGVDEDSAGLRSLLQRFCGPTNWSIAK